MPDGSTSAGGRAHLVPPSPLSTFSPRPALGSSTTSSVSLSSSLDDDSSRLHGAVYESSPAYVKPKSGRGWQPTPAPPYTRSALALLVPATQLEPRRHPPLSKRYFYKPGRPHASGLQLFTLPPQFAHDRDVARRARVYEELLVATLERRLGDKAGRMEGVGLEGGREVRLLAGVNAFKRKIHRAILFPTVPPSTAPERTSSLGPRNLSPKQSRAISPSNPRSLTHRRIHSSPAPLPPPPADESGPTQLLRSFILRTGGRHESNLSLDELELARLSKERATLGPTCKAERTKHAALLEACAAQGAVEDVTPVPGWDAESEAGSSESDGSDEDGVDVLVDIKLVSPAGPPAIEPILLPDFAPLAVLHMTLISRTQPPPTSPSPPPPPPPTIPFPLQSPVLTSPPQAFLRPRSFSAFSRGGSRVNLEGVPLGRRGTNSQGVERQRLHSGRMWVSRMFGGEPGAPKREEEGRLRKRSWFGAVAAAA